VRKTLRKAIRKYWQLLAYTVEATVVAAGFGLLRVLSVDRASALGGLVARRIGPLLPVHRVGQRNLAAAFPEKGTAEIERILQGVWDNLGRTGAEYAHLDRLWDIEPSDLVAGGRIVDVVGFEQVFALRDQGKAALFFTGHCGNWEVLPIGAARHGVPLAVMFRIPNNPYSAAMVKRIRRRSMGRLLPSGLMGTVAAAEVLSRGEHLGMLIDQYYTRGIEVPFFGRPVRTAPTLAKLARRFDCAVIGAFIERVEGARFRLVVNPPLPIAWTEDAATDERAVMAAATRQIEDWVRVHPEQWLWLHRRWR
jgi:Kdo2-lipid IVA lauroyltransferase/acyltransferase